MAELRESPRTSSQFVGSAVVAGASYGAQHTILRLETFRGEYIDYRIGGVPDPEGMVKFQGAGLRPLSVKIQQGGQRCSVVAIGADGPRSFIVLLGTALALHKAGVHAVVDGGLPIAVPCSIKPRTALR
ncbi:hypothetical protein [Arthrobacter sp. NPDC057009]|uniref:hypothetical protein n=1 Tax=Arthrobacter sp. NPDC057009 TaxID=3345996 RepID=UPI00362F930A